MSLYDLIQDPDKRRTVVDDSNLVLEAEVRSKGFMVKTAFKVVKGIKPGFIPMAIDNLLDDFSQQLDPHYATWDQGGRSGTLEQHFVKNGQTIANDLLSVTDHRADCQVEHREESLQKTAPRSDKAHHNSHAACG